MTRLHVDVRLACGEASFVAPRGEVTVIEGASGAGKSTLLDAIAGLVRPERGSVRLGAEVWFDAAANVDTPTERRNVGYVLQGLALFPHMTALENVAYALPRSIPRGERHRQAAALLDRFHVGGLGGRSAKRVSGGEAQRIALARAAARTPSVYLLDEPFSALDPPLKEALGRVLAELLLEAQVPMVIALHAGASLPDALAPRANFFRLGVR